MVGFPKPVYKKKSKVKEWDKARVILKKAFEAMGITTCEVKLAGCQPNFALGFAHLDKRRFLTKADLFKVVLACGHCHHILDFVLSRAEMRALLEGIIKRREANLKGGDNNGY